MYWLKSAPHGSKIDPAGLFLALAEAKNRRKEMQKNFQLWILRMIQKIGPVR